MRTMLLGDIFHVEEANPAADIPISNGRIWNKSDLDIDAGWPGTNKHWSNYWLSYQARTAWDMLGVRLRGVVIDGLVSIE